MGGTAAASSAAVIGQRRDQEHSSGDRAQLFEAMAVRIWLCLLVVAFFAAAWASGASSVPEQETCGSLGKWRSCLGRCSTKGDLRSPPRYLYALCCAAAPAIALDFHPIAGGSAISPMLQVVRAPDGNTKVLYTVHKPSGGDRICYIYNDMVLTDLSRTTNLEPRSRFRDVEAPAMPSPELLN